MVCESMLMKFDPYELVKDYFPSTADFELQFRDGVQLYAEHKVVEYEAHKMTKEE